MRKTLKREVEVILERYPDSRNSDITLLQLIWKVFHAGDLIENNGNSYVNIKKLMDLPREDAVSRIRRKIQNEEHKFVPTDKKIAIARGFQEDEWREFLGYPTSPSYIYSSHNSPSSSTR